MGEKQNAEIGSDSQIVLDSIRRFVRTLRSSSKMTEKTLGLSTAQIFVLHRLAKSQAPLSINALAKATLTHQSSVSVVVSKLVKRKLIDRIVSSTDSRSVELRLSKQGEYLLSKSPISIQERLMEAVAALNESERKGLVQGLQALILKAGMAEEKPSMLMEEDDDIELMTKK